MFFEFEISGHALTQEIRSGLTSPAGFRFKSVFFGRCEFNGELAGPGFKAQETLLLDGNVRRAPGDVDVSHTVPHGRRFFMRRVGAFWFACFLLLATSAAAESLYWTKSGTFGADSLATLQRLDKYFDVKDEEAIKRLLQEKRIFVVPQVTVCHVMDRVGKRAVLVRPRGQTNEFWVFPWNLAPVPKSKAPKG